MLGRKLPAAALSLLTQTMWSYNPSFLWFRADRICVPITFHECPALIASRSSALVGNAGGAKQPQGWGSTSNSTWNFSLFHWEKLHFRWKPLDLSGKRACTPRSHDWFDIIVAWLVDAQVFATWFVTDLGDWHASGWTPVLAEVYFDCSWSCCEWPKITWLVSSSTMDR